MSHHSLIEQVNNEGLIVPSKEIRVAVFHQKNTKTITKEAMIKKRVKEKSTDEKRAMTMTKINVSYNSKTTKSTSDQPSTLDQIMLVVFQFLPDIDGIQNKEKLTTTRR